MGDEVKVDLIVKCLGNGFGEVVAEFDKITKASEKFKDSSDKTNVVIAALAQNTQGLSGRFETFKSMLDGATPKSMQLAAAFEKVKTDFETGKISIDQARDAIDKLGKEMDEAGLSSKNMGLSAQGGAEKAALSFTDMKSAIDMVIGTAKTAGAILKQAFDLGQEGAAIAQTTESFERINEVMSITPGLLDRLREAAMGTISDMDLMSSTTKLLSGSSEELGQKLGEATPQLLEIAKAANKVNPSLGSTAFLYESISLGIKRASPMILDNLGIIVKVGDANEKYAEQLGKTVEQLTVEEQKIALLNGVLEQGANLMEQAGGSAETAGDSYARLTTHIDNITDALKVQLSEVLLPTIEALDDLTAGQIAVSNAVKKGIITNDDASAMVMAMKGGMLDYAGVMEYLNEKTEEQSARVEYLQGALGPLAPMYEAAAVSAGTATTAVEEQALTAEEAAKKAEEYNARLNEMREANEALRASAANAAIEQSNLAVALNGIKDPADLAKQQISLLQEAMKNDPENAAVYEEQINAIAVSAGLASENTVALAGAVGVLPDLLATGVIDDYAAAWDVLTKYLETDVNPTFGGLIEALETAGLTSGTQAEIINQSLDLEPSIEESGRLVDMLDDIANAPLTRSFNYTVNVRVNGPAGLITGSGNGGVTIDTGYESGGPGGANGLDFIVPPGNPNDTFPFRAQTGERVQVTPANKIDDSSVLLQSTIASLPRLIELAVVQGMAKAENR